MAINKMTFTGVGGIDLTGDTAVETDVASGKIFHKADGTQATGTANIGGDTLADLYLKQPVTLLNYENEEATLVGGYAFAQSSIREVNLPNVQNLGWYSFYNCTDIFSISFPKVNRVQTSTFQSCSNLASVSFPLATAIDTNAFKSCPKLSQVVAPQITSIGEGAFYFSFIKEGVSLNFPLLESIGPEAFRSSKLKNISIPNIQSIQNWAFASCILEELTLPSSCTTFGTGVFQGCNKLKKLVIEASLTQIPTNFLQFCSAMEELDLSHCIQVPTLGSTSYLQNIPSTCVIKVPASLETEWKQATNWVAFASQIVGV